MFIMNIKFNNTFGSKINYVLTRVFTSKIKDDFFVRVVLRILSQKVVIFDRIPYNTDSSKVLSENLIRHWYKTNIDGTINWSTSCHGLTGVECFRSFSSENIRDHFLNKRDSRGTSNHFNGKIRVLLEIKLYFRLDSAFNIGKSWSHLT